MALVFQRYDTSTGKFVGLSEISNSHLSATAGISLSKLASGTDGQIIVANGSGVPSFVAMSGHVAILNTGATAIQSSVITNDMLAESITYANLSIADADLSIAKTSGLQDALDAKIASTEKGAANGVCPLNASSKIDSSYLSGTFLGALVYKGVHDASTEAYPADPETGDFWVASVAGTISGVDYQISDWMAYNGSTWDKIDNTDKVASVNGATGTVVLDADDISDAATTNKFYASSLFDSDFSGKDTDDLSEGTTNKYYASSLFDTDFSGKDTDDLAEGTAKFYATSLFNTDFAASDLANLGTKSHTSLTDIGSNTHAQIDTHLGSSSNPHSVTKAQVLAAEGIVDADIESTISYAKLNIADADLSIAKTSGLQTALDARVNGATAKTNDNAEAITVGEVVYVKSNGNVDLAQADAVGTARALFIVKDASIASAASGDLYLPNQVVGGFTGLTVGATQFLSAATAGELTETAPSASGDVVVEIGYAISATEIVFLPREIIVIE